jgi:hypothetical protein
MAQFVLVYKGGKPAGDPQATMAAWGCPVLANGGTIEVYETIAV